MLNWDALDALKETYVNKKALHDVLSDNIQHIQEKIESYTTELSDLEKCNVLLSTMASMQRQDACSKLEDICSYALQYATGRNLKMRLDMKQYRNKIAAEVTVVKPDTGVENFPLDGGGGGLADIISMALRFTMLAIYNNPHVDGPVIFDEPAKNVSADYIPKVADFLMRSSTDFDRQIILSTHNEYIAGAAPKRFRFALNENDVTTVTEETNEEDSNENTESSQ